MSLRFGKGHGLQGFVFCSAYRISTNEFVALGLSALALHSHMEVDSCRWTRPDHSVVTGKLVASYPGDAHQKRYEIALLTCTLEEAVSSYRGGQLTMTIEQEDLPVYGEKPGSKNPTTPEPPYKSKLTFCSSPIYGDISEAHFVEWLEFHRVTHGVDYFHIYDAGGINPSLRAKLKPYLSARMMTITDVRAINQFETWLYAQLLAINDCAYRTQFTSEWALFMDIDEYLYVTKPPHSILEILDANQDAMWVTFGSKFFYTDKCTPSAIVSEDSPQPWSVEFLIYRQTEVHCKHVSKYGNRTHCLAFDGHRKYIVNPRKIEVCGIHAVVRPQVGGVHMSTDDVHLNHFRGLNLRDWPTCTVFLNDNSSIPNSWTRDVLLASLARFARSGRMR